VRAVNAELATKMKKLLVEARDRGFHEGGRGEVNFGAAMKRFGLVLL